EAGEERAAPGAPPGEGAPDSDFLRSLATVLVVTGISLLLRHRVAPSNLILVYLLGGMVVAIRFGRGPAILASVLSVAGFDFFFVPPYNTFAVSDTQYLITFAVMLAAALVISTMAARMREQTRASRERESRTAALYKLTRELAGLQD